ncbi:MAG: hypothetical protein GF334_01110 [Candidatus Altiarchaeales archaeon]|nr:hypothetical protein [Candidatus Altiarchaeales archaeon]
MAVRITRDFWTNFRTHEEMLHTAFLHWHKVFPNPEGEEAAWNELLISFHDLDVFKKWDTARLVFNKKALVKLQESKSAAEIQAMAEKRINKRKINVETKFKYFIFRWVQQALSNAYQKRIRDRYRFVRWDRAEQCNSQNYLSLVRNSGITAWDQDEINGAKKHGSARYHKRREVIERKQKRAAHDAPTINDIHEYYGDTYTHPLEKLIAQETRQRMRDCLPTSLERKVFDLKQEGYSGVDIAFLVPDQDASTKRCKVSQRKKRGNQNNTSITPSYVSLISNRIKERCAKVAVL